VSPDGRIFLATSNQDGRANNPFPVPGDDRIIEILSLNAPAYCSSERSASICSGETYNFYGLEISQAGTYYDTVPGGNECDTIVTLELEVAAAYTTEDEIKICAGDSVQVNGEYQSGEGIYVDTLSSVNGCDSVLSVQISYFNEGDIGVPDSILMDLDDTLTITADEGFVSYKWNDDTPSQSNTITVVAADLGEGTHHYTIEVENADGCVLLDTMTIAVTQVVGIRDISGLEFSVYPNPVEGEELKIDYSISSEAVLIIYNQAGMEVYRKMLSPLNHHTRLSLSGESGLYHLKISNNEGTGSVKILKH
jgi:hypothetical protein